MDILLVAASSFELPSSYRVGAILHDGAADLTLWRGPGSDRALRDAYGPDLTRTLETARSNLEGNVAAVGDVVRLHPGRLHCDFLLWLATREPERGTERSSAPGEELVRKTVNRALEFVAARGVAKVAVSAVGATPGQEQQEQGDAERLSWVVKVAHEYQTTCFSEGRAPVIESVMVCDPRQAVVTRAAREVADLVRVAGAPAVTRKHEEERVTATRAPRTGSHVRLKGRLPPGEVAEALASALPYDWGKRYSAGDWFVHAKFGVARVERITPEDALEVLFEDGTRRKMIHARAR